MTRQEAQAIMARLTAYYPRVDLSPEHVEIWVGELMAYPRDAAAAAAEKIKNTSKWFPSWAEFRDVLLVGDMPEPEIAWGIAWGNRGMSGGNPLIRKAVQACGGDSQFRSCTNPGSLRKLFLPAYQAALEDFRKTQDNFLLGKPYEKPTLEPKSEAEILREAGWTND